MEIRVSPKISMKGTLLTKLNYSENRDSNPIICLPRFPLSKAYNFLLNRFSISMTNLS